MAAEIIPQKAVSLDVSGLTSVIAEALNITTLPSAQPKPITYTNSFAELFPSDFD